MQCAVWRVKDAGTRCTIGCQQLKLKHCTAIIPMAFSCLCARASYVDRVEMVARAKYFVRLLSMQPINVRGQRFGKLRLMWRNNCERRGEKYFARAKNDVWQKWSGCYAPPMTNVGAKYFSPVPQMMRGRNRQAVRRHQRPTSGRNIFRPCKR